MISQGMTKVIRIHSLASLISVLDCIEIHSTVVNTFHKNKKPKLWKLPVAFEVRSEEQRGRIHPLRTINVYNTILSNPSNSSFFHSIFTKVVDWLTRWYYCLSSHSPSAAKMTVSCFFPPLIFIWLWWFVVTPSAQCLWMFRNHLWWCFEHLIQIANPLTHHRDGWSRLAISGNA